jgi:hypothetical protein
MDAMPAELLAVLHNLVDYSMPKLHADIDTFAASAANSTPANSVPTPVTLPVTPASFVPAVSVPDGA